MHSLTLWHMHLQGSFLEDLHRLHVPTLLWAPQPAVAGRPSRALRRIAGHTLSGLLAFGGCIPTIMGIMPVAKVDLLLLGAVLPWSCSLRAQHLWARMSLQVVTAPLLSVSRQVCSLLGGVLHNHSSETAVSALSSFACW